MRWRDIPAAIAAAGRNYVCGRVSRAFTLRVIGPLTNGGFAVGTTLAIACVPTSYDVRHAWVSSLASARTNPSGYFYLGTTLMVVALLLVPLPGHLSRQFRPRGRASVAGALLLWVGIVGLFLLSVETTFFLTLVFWEWAAVIALFVGGYLTAWAAPRDGSRPPP